MQPNIIKRQNFKEIGIQTMELQKKIEQGFLQGEKRLEQQYNQYQKALRQRLLRQERNLINDIDNTGKRMAMYQ